MSSGLTVLLDSPFYSGTAAQSSAPLPHPAAIDGRGYVIDFSFPMGQRNAFNIQSIPMMRAQADTSNIPSEASLNPDGLWRRSQSSWHSGAGQTYLDKDDSIPSRFRSSKGIDPWTKFQITLLNDVHQALSSAQTNLYMVVAGSRLYTAENTALKYTTDVTAGSPSWTTVTGTSGVAIRSVTSDGYTIWISDGTDIYSTNRTIGTASSFSTYDADVIAYVKGRLMAAKANLAFNITGAATKTDVVTQANTDFVFNCFAEGPSNIYMGGFSGDKSLIYRTAVTADGTSLSAGVVAGELPDGEILRSMQGYLGFLVLGTDKGVRFCELDSNGNLQVGDLISTANPVYCFEPQDRFVWYGNTNYDLTSTGLGRLDLRTFNLTAPAYASDLMVTGQGIVQSVVTFQSVRVFSVSGLGIYNEDTSKKVASGMIDSGLITYGLADPKIAMFEKIDMLPLVGSITSYLSLDGGTFTQVGSIAIATTTTEEYPTPQTLSNHFEIRQILARSSSTDAVGPTLLRHTLRANPAVKTGLVITLPLRLHEEMMVGGVEEPLVPSTELLLFEDLRNTGRVCVVQIGSSSYIATLEDTHWLPASMGRLNQELNGTAVLTLKTVN